MMKVVLQVVGNVTQVVWIIMFLFVACVMKESANSSLPSINVKNLQDPAAIISTLVFYFFAFWAQSLCFTGFAIGMRMRNSAMSERRYFMRGEKALIWLWMLFHFLILPLNVISFKNIGGGGDVAVAVYLSCVVMLGVFCSTLIAKKTSLN